MRDSDVNLYDFERLRREFGPVVETPASGGPARVERELIGDSYRRILRETTKIVAYQWREHLDRSALKGFLFHGGVGIGKTSMAKRVAYELGRLLSGPDNEVVLVAVDGADIARGRYGETEERLRELFEYARTGEVGYHGHRHEDEPLRHTVLLFDDVESLFLTRNSEGAKEWHFSQNSVFFHSIDELDTAHTVVLLTTNRFDLLDEAIVDRFLAYEFGTPSVEVLEEVAREKARLQHLTETDLGPVLHLIRQDGHVTSIREVERLVTRAFVDKVLAG
ncbi:MAG TPA: ATP-binding protein [Chloroflexota bacterium]|jgi:AAA+ superfamily predicted ATPase|nr:ATP-binding protein [Chloroflexota bacterium]